MAIYQSGSATSRPEAPAPSSCREVPRDDSHSRQDGRFGKLMDCLPEPVYHADEGGRLLWFNMAGRRLFGYTAADLQTGLALWDLVIPADRGRLQEKLLHRANGRDASRTYTALRRDGGTFPALIYGNPVLDEGRITGVIGLIARLDGRRQPEADPKGDTGSEPPPPGDPAPVRKTGIDCRAPAEPWHRFGDIIGKSPQMRAVYEVILKAAATHANVIIYGESGTGKELVARAIHQLSDRSAQRFVPVNCGAIPEGLLESEFFGYKKGAFTGAHTDKQGYLDLAHGGSLFLDELGEIGQNIQVKLLRAIEGGEYTPVGSSESKTSDVRIIAATNQDLMALVKKGVVREDFFYRIHILPIHLPPLRERKEDLPFLVEHFKSKYDKDGPPIPDQVLKTLMDYDWPGNVRELQNVLHRYVTLKKLDLIGVSPAAPESPPSEIPPAEPGTGVPPLQDALGDYEKKLLLQALNRHRWHRGKTAAALGVNRKTLFMKMKKFGLI